MIERETVTERKHMRKMKRVREGKCATDRKRKQIAGSGREVHICESERRRRSMHKRGERCNRKSMGKVPERGKAH